MNGHKLPGVEFVVQIGDGFTQHVPAATDMQATVVICCFNSLNLFDGEKNFLFDVLHEQARDVRL
jgi:hypothetical protein